MSSSDLQPNTHTEPTDRENPIALGYTLEELIEWPIEDFENFDLLKLEATPAHILASFLERHKVDERRSILRLLSEAQASDVLSEMNIEDTAETMGAMREWRAVKILEECDADDAADIVSELNEDDRDRLLDKLMPETAATVRHLLTYDEDTAGGIMNPNVASVPLEATIDEAIAHLRAIKDKVEHFHYIYVLGPNHHLEGVVSMRDLLLATPQQLIADIFHRNLQGVCLATDDKEAVALSLADLNLSALPVVDEHYRLLGIVTYDDVIDIIQEEATEDIQRLVGAGPNESIHHTIFFSVSRRSPWLFVNLLTAFIGSWVISTFNHEIEAFGFLAVFMSLIASLGGNTGAQTLAVAIRSLALGELHAQDSSWVCLKECLKGLFNGLLLGCIAGSLTYLWTMHLKLSGVIVISCILNMGLAGIAGAFIPLFLKKLHLDPAQSSSIFLTAITDIAGYLIFLTLGSWLIL